MEKKVEQFPKNSFYTENKDLFDIIAFLGVICALFLQVPQDTIYVKQIQALLFILLILSLSLLVLSLLAFIDSIIKRPQTYTKKYIHTSFRLLSLLFTIYLIFILGHFVLDMYINEIKNLIIGMFFISLPFCILIIARFVAEKGEK